MTARLSLPRPLRFRDYRVLWLASVLSGAGFQGEFVVLGWYLLEATDSAFVVGLSAAVRTLPNVLIGLPGGALVDHWDRRLMLRLMSALTAASTLILAGLALTSGPIWAFFALTLVGGALRSLFQMARQSYAFDIVGGEMAMSGLAFMNLAQRVGGVAGSLAMGFVIATRGAGEAYAALAACFALSAVVMLFARERGQSAPSSRQSPLTHMREFALELRHNRTLAVLALLVAAVEVLGFSHQSVLPVLARDVLEAGPESLGALSAAGAFGGLISTLLFSLLGEVRRRGLLFIVVLNLFGVALVLLGNAGSIELALVAVMAVSALAALSDVLSQGLAQLAVPNEMRGRAMGMWTLAIGSAPLGHAEIGALAAVYGAPAALIVNGVALTTMAASAALGVKRIVRL